MVRLILAGLLLAFAANGASIQSLPDWEGHSGSVTIRATTGSFGTGTLIDQQTYVFTVGHGAEVAAGLGVLAVDIANTGVYVRALADRPWPNVHFIFTLNGPVQSWFAPDWYWGDIVLQKDSGALFLPQGGGQIPEPSTYGLMAGGLGALALLRRRLSGR